MGLRKFIADKIISKKITEAIVNDRVQDKVENIKESVLGMEGGFRRMSDDNNDRDLSPMKHDKHIQVAYYLYMQNPLAHRILEYTKVFIVGDGFTVSAPDEQTNKVIQEFWNVNGWKLNQSKKALQLGMFGEQVYPAFVNDVNGKVRLGYLDPFRISEIKTNPENSEEKKTIIVKGKSGLKGKQYKIINNFDKFYEHEKPDKPKLLKGNEAFYFSVNDVSNSSRGYSDLLSMEDWLDAYDQVIFNFVERSKLLQSFIWDIELTGANDKEIKERRQKLEGKRPKAGTFVVHGDEEKWQQITPDLRSRDNIEEARHIRTLILSGAGYPNHWFSEGDGTTRATALAQGTPTLRVLKERQNYFKYMIETIIEFVIEQAVAANELSRENDLSFKVHSSELDVDDFTSLAGSLPGIATAVQMFLDNRVMTREAGIKFAGFILRKMGFKIDSKKEVEQILADKDQLKKEYDRLERTLEKLRDAGLVA